MQRRFLVSQLIATAFMTCTLGACAHNNAEDVMDEANEPVVDEDAPGYILVQIDAIEDPDTFFTDYANRAGPTLVKHGFVGMVASAEPSRFEGEAPDGWTVMLQFPSVAEAQAWYDDPEYAAARPFRIDFVGQTDMVLMQGQVDAGDDLSRFGGYLLEQSERVETTGAFEDYLRASEASMSGFGGAVLVEGEPVRVLEGAWPDHSTRVVGFPSTDAIERWYGATESAALHDDRNGAAKGQSLAGFARFCVPELGDCG